VYFFPWLSSFFFPHHFYSYLPPQVTCVRSIDGCALARWGRKPFVWLAEFFTGSRFMKLAFVVPLPEVRVPSPFPLRILPLRMASRSTDQFSTPRQRLVERPNRFFDHLVRPPDATLESSPHVDLPDAQTCLGFFCMFFCISSGYFQPKGKTLGPTINPPPSSPSFFHRPPYFHGQEPDECVESPHELRTSRDWWKAIWFSPVDASTREGPCLISRHFMW